MGPKRNKKRKSAPVAEHVESNVASAPFEDPFSRGQVRHVVTMVALCRGVVSLDVDNWVNAVSTNLETVGVYTMRDIVESGSNINVLLARARLPRLHGTTIQEILHEVCLMIQWPGDEPESGD